MKLSWIPNAICVARIILVGPIVWTLLGRDYSLALALIVLAGVSDAIDGFLAKSFGWHSRLGSLLDPAADKLLLMSVFVMLTYLGLVPVALTGIVILRDVVIVLGALAYQLLIGTFEGRPIAISKVNTAFQLGFIVFTVTHAAFVWPPRISLDLLGAGVVFTSITSGLAYVLGWGKRAWRMRDSGDPAA
jgi:cardiolipin synthase